MTIEENEANGEETDASQVPAGSDYVSERTFADFPISPELLQGITDKGYVHATPVQSATIEAALAGRDIVARAKTGTGKTAAFAIPILDRIQGDAGYTQAVILAPVRELANQIAEECEELAAHLGVHVALLVGGVAMGPQEKALEAGAALVVGTPGRVLDHYRRNNLDLSRVAHICLDEADEMLSMGFYEDVTKVLKGCAEGRQILLFSATVSGDTERLVSKYLNEPEQVYLSSDEDKVEGIDHVLYEAPTSGMHKARALLYLLDMEDPKSAIIFCNTREDTNTVAAFLDKQGLDVQLISGELAQARRTIVMKKVKAGEVRFLVATDVAARGIDISGLTHVINYNLPKDAKVYLHRIGRTGRIGNKGTAITLTSASDMSTRKTLQNVHAIDFDVKDFPPEEDCVRRRVERQAATIQAAMGTIIFESYLPTVDGLLALPNGKALLAAALRGFFTWDRQRRAGDDGLVVPRKESRGDSRKGGSRDRDRDRDRGSRDRGGRDRDRGGRDRDRGGRGRDRDDRRSRRDEGSSDSLDLDALLVEDSSPAPKSAEGDDQRKRKRRRGKKRTGDSDGASSDTASSNSNDELDAMLSFD